MERRLAAILIADIVGYSRLMGQDEARTLAAMTELRERLFDPVVRERGGRILKRMGDGWIVEFPNIMDAVTCAVAIQDGLAAHEVVRLRIGVHIGDVTFGDDDVYGDGINVAARLEAMAAPGEILISDTAQQSLDGKTLEGFTGGDLLALKNIARPVAVWRRAGAGGTPGQAAAAKPPEPEKLSIAVLPFENLSGDPGQGFLSDGIAEDIITELLRFGWFFVIGRSSAFTYRGDAIDTQRTGRELGARYVLKGSVRKAGTRIRVAVQLIEAESGTHVWADRYDRELVDVFDLQDEIALTIAAKTEPELLASENRRTRRTPPSDLGAWELVHRSAQKIYANGRQNLLDAEALCRQAIERDQTFARAHCMLAYAVQRRIYQGWSADRAADVALAIRHAKTAIAIDPAEYLGHTCLGWLLLLQDNLAEALNEFELAAEANPIDIHVRIGLAAALTANEEFERTLRLADETLQRNPADPGNWAMLGYKAAACRRLGRIDEAIATFRAAARSPAAGINVYLGLAVSCLENAQPDEARAAVERAREIQPHLSIRFFEQNTFASTLNPTARVRFVEALRAVGVPEELPD